MVRCAGVPDRSDARQERVDQEALCDHSGHNRRDRRGVGQEDKAREVPLAQFPGHTSSLPLSHNTTVQPA